MRNIIAEIIYGESGDTLGAIGEYIPDIHKYNIDEMHLKYIETAKQEGNKKATQSFEVANKVEKIHAKRSSKAIEDLENNKVLANTDYYVCEVCGNTFAGVAPERCPICGAPKKQFKIIQ